MLSEGEQRLWEEAISSLNDENIDFRPVRLVVDSVIELPIEIYNAIEVNRARHKMPDEHVERALEFFGDLVQSEDKREIISGLTYEETVRGKEVLLPSPGRPAPTDRQA